MIRSADLDADIIVIGAGVAGLAFAGALTNPGRRVRLIVLEPREIRPNPRRWIIAAEPGHALGRFADERLNQVSLAGQAHRLGRLRIDHVRAQTVQAAVLDQIDACPTAQLEEGVDIGPITRRGDSVRVETRLGGLSARAVLDTRPGAAAGVGSDQWTQIIKRVRLENVDQPRGFTLSPFFADPAGISIHQTLILGGGEAVVEVARFAPPGDQGEGLSEALQALIDSVGGDAVGPRTRLVLPLDHRSRQASSGAAIVARAGIGGLRFGTGTAAVRMTRWAEAAAARFANTGRLRAPPRPPAQARAAAALAMTHLKTDPNQAAAWFNAVLTTAGAERALRFLAGTPGWRDGALAFLRVK